jgi:hypothetical protein
MSSALKKALQGPNATISGTVVTVNQDSGFFRVALSPYSNIYRRNVPMEISCSFPDTPRFRNSKPFPREGSMVTVQGWMTGFDSDGVSSKRGYLELDVEDIVFLGFLRNGNNPTVRASTYFHSFFEMGLTKL